MFKNSTFYIFWFYYITPLESGKTLLDRKGCFVFAENANAYFQHIPFRKGHVAVHLSTGAGSEIPHILTFCKRICMLVVQLCPTL